MALEKQMDLFQEGGMIDEGGTTDPVSGNDVPTGSLKKEVRDDIPAQLSEGEFVMPADVVRFHGLDKMMALRDEAKMGLRRMEDMGQMGNSEEATIPDGIPFNMDDLELEDEPMEMQVGGFVQPLFTPGGMQQSQFAQYQPQFTPYQMPNYTQPTMPAYTPPQQAATPMAPTAVPQFSSFVTPTYVTYVNDAGNTIQIPVGPDGKPLIPVPAGFRPQDAAPETPETAPTTEVAPTTVAQPSGGGDNGPPAAPGPRLDQFGREEDPRIAQVTQSEQFAKLAKDVDPRGFLEKIKDDFLGAVGASTTSQEYQKALNELSVGIANYTADPEEQSKLMAEIRGNLNQATRTELGMEKAPSVTPEQIAEQKFLNQFSDMKAGDFDFYGDAGVGVETARVTEEAGTTAAQVAERRLEASKTDIEKRMNDLGLQGNQRKEFLNAIINQEKTSIDFKSGRGFPESYTGIMPDTTVDFTPAPSIAQAQAQTGAAQRLLNEQVQRESQTARDVLTTLGTKPTRDEPIYREPDPASDVLPGEPGSDTPPLSRREVERQTTNYRNRGYSPSAAASAARNKVAADNAAKQQMRDSGQSEATVAKTTAVTDSNGNAVTSGSDGSIVTSGPKDDDPGPSKSIVCTEMYRQTQLDDWAKAMKIWDVYQRKYLTPHHEIGYHWLFKPYVKGMRKSNVLTQFGAFLARKRTLHLKYILTKGIAKDDIVGNVWCKIIHPLVYIAGRTKEWLKLQMN